MRRVGKRRDANAAHSAGAASDETTPAYRDGSDTSLHPNFAEERNGRGGEVDHSTRPCAPRGRKVGPGCSSPSSDREELPSWGEFDAGATRDTKCSATAAATAAAGRIDDAREARVLVALASAATPSRAWIEGRSNREVIHGGGADRAATTTARERCATDHCGGASGRSRIERSSARRHRGLSPAA